MNSSPPSGAVKHSAQVPSETPQLFAAGATLPFVLVTALFLFWGIPSNMNDILIKQFMKSFEITRFQAGLIQFAYFIGYFIISMPRR